MRRANLLLSLSMLVIAISKTLAAADPPATTMPTTRGADAVLADRQTDYESAAPQVMRHIQTAFYLPNERLYAHSLTKRHPEFMWGNGVMFSALLGAARHEPQTYGPLVPRFFEAMDRYWDLKAKPPGYEPLPTAGGGHDKYFDDNAWMVLTDCEAFEMTQDRRYLQRSQQVLEFVLSGWDEQAGGGIWWHEGHKAGSKNTCVNAPAAVGCLRVAKFQDAARAEASVAMAKRIVEWTDQKLRTQDGLYADNIKVESGKRDEGKLTYNTALMIRAFLGLYRHTGDEQYLRRAKRAATAAEWFLDARTHAYRDPVKWSHLMVEADLELYRTTREDYLLRRAADNADHQYARWKQHPPDALIDNASIARTLWMMADVRSPAAQRFWQRVDQPN